MLEGISQPEQTGVITGMTEAGGLSAFFSAKPEITCAIDGGLKGKAKIPCREPRRVPKGRQGPLAPTAWYILACTSPGVRGGARRGVRVLGLTGSQCVIRCHQCMLDY